ncbi:hypothetical protein DFH09DRAFT_1409997 [Mycena vulgaris]|nr:hypothetical protein DFH09DRAFT_1409997 [Mycena vulgaris]
MTGWTCSINDCINPVNGAGLDQNFGHYASKVPFGWIVAQKVMVSTSPRISLRMMERVEILQASGTQRLLDGHNIWSLRAKGIHIVKDVGAWIKNGDVNGYVFRERDQIFHRNWTGVTRNGWVNAANMLSQISISSLFDRADELLLEHSERREDTENMQRRYANPACLQPSATAGGQQVWVSDGSMVSASAGLLQTKSVTTSIMEPTTLVLCIGGNNILSTQGELIGLTGTILFADTSESIPKLYADYLNAVKFIKDKKLAVKQDMKLRCMNTWSYYQWILALLDDKVVETKHTKGHTDELTIPSLMNYKNESDNITRDHPQQMLTSVCGCRPPPDFPYTCAYTAHSAAIQLYARSGQLPVAATMYKRKKNNDDGCISDAM